MTTITQGRNAIFSKNPAGQTVWREQAGDKYAVTGVRVDGSRFKGECASWHYCKGINLYRGTRWLIRNGRRYKIEEVWN